MNTSSKLVSCIVTTYNRDVSIIERALISIVNQTYKNIEIILVNDNPKNSHYTKNIENYLSANPIAQIRMFQNDYNMGACISRNIGIKNAKGDYIAFLDDDDEWMPDKLRLLLNAFDDDSVVMAYSQRYNYYEETDCLELYKGPGFSGYIFQNLLVDNFIGSTSCPILKRSCLLEIGMFNENLPSLQDYDVWLRMSKVGKVVFVEKPLFKFHIYKGERISNNYKKAIQGRLMFIDIYYNDLKKNNVALGYRYTSLAHFYAKNKEKCEALKILLKGLLISPFDLKRNGFEILHTFYSIFKY